MLDVLVLSTEECLALLRRGVLRRLITCAPRGPHVLLVNYSFAHGAVYFQTHPAGVAAQSQGHPVAFAIDHVDYEWQNGWSGRRPRPAARGGADRRARLLGSRRPRSAPR